MSRGEGICCECGYMVRSRMKVVATIFSVVFILSGAVIVTGGANPPAFPPPQVITITVNQTCITPGGVAEITARALDSNGAPHEWSLRFKIINGPADAELSTVEGAYEDYDYYVNVTDASGYAHAKLKAGARTGTVEIMVYYVDQTDGVSYVTASNTTDVIIATQCEGPELVVTKVEPNCGFMFANESNIISATIQNSGTEAAGAFNVSFEIAGVAKKEVRIAEGLATNSSVEVTVTDDSVHKAGESVAIRVNADCNAEIQEIDESNNIKEVDEAVVNNGYKGKRYTEGASGDISTWRRYAVKGNVIYSTGDSQYLSGSKTPWYDYTVNWSALSVPGTVKEARLYVYYNWDKVQGMPDNVSLKFNGDTITRDAFYTDRKGYDGSNYPYGMLVYNVTTEFNKAGTNTAVLENHYPVAGNPSINGMLLVIVYESETEPRRVILINEGYDLLYGGSSKCTSADEATAFAPFTYFIEDPANVSARLITVAPDASGEGELIFNGHVWHDAWDFSGDSRVGIDDCDVSAYLNTTNEAAFQSSGDYMEASNAILVLGEIGGHIVINASATPQIIPEDTDNVPLWGELSNLSIVVTDVYTITSVTIDLSSIGGNASQAMIPGGNNVWYYETNASLNSAIVENGSYVPHRLPVIITDERGHSKETYIELTVMRNGDVCPYNGDGEVDFMHDALYLARHTRGVQGYEAIRKNIADVTGDGEVDFMHDALYLARHTRGVQGYEKLH